MSVRRPQDNTAPRPAHHWVGLQGGHGVSIPIREDKAPGAKLSLRDGLLRAHRGRRDQAGQHPSRKSGDKNYSESQLIVHHILIHEMQRIGSKKITLAARLQP
jgi:hypothetical protein